MKFLLNTKSAALIAALALASPALRAAGAAEAQPVPAIQTSSPGGVVVSSAHGRWIKGRLLISGIVHRKAGYSYPGPMQSHLDFIVLDSSQRNLSLTQVNYLPRPIPIVYRGIPSRAAYAAYLPITPPAGATVRVAHHQASTEECQQNSPAANTKETLRPKVKRVKEGSGRRPASGPGISRANAEQDAGELIRRNAGQR